MTLYVQGEWTGWDGATCVKLSDASGWVQDDYHYEYRYSYWPKASIENTNRMTVAGMNRAVRVRRA